MNNRAALRQGTVVTKARAIPFTSYGDDHLAIDPAAGACWALDRVGHRIWELLDSPASIGSICAQLRREYAVDEETCLRDVTELIATFVDEGLVIATDE